MYVFRNSGKIDICLEILRKFKGIVKKLLKQVILRKFFIYFGNIFKKNCNQKFQVHVRKIIIYKLWVAIMTHDHDDIPHAILTLLMVPAGK